MVAKGLSASQIAKQLSDETGIYFSRNAVIGKTHRLGLDLEKSTAKYSRAQQGRQPKTTNTATLKFKPRKPSLADIAKQVRDVPPPDARMLYFEELEAQHCRWPAEGSGLDTRYCGAWRVDPHPYCAHHVLRAYQPFKRHDGA